MEVESKSVHAPASAEKLYNFLSDFSNIARMVPAGAGGSVVVNGNTCTINVGGYLSVTLAFEERVPYSRLVLGPAGNGFNTPFKLVFDIRDGGSNSCDIRAKFDMAGSNPMLNMMLKSKLKGALDSLMDQLQYYANAL